MNYESIGSATTRVCRFLLAAFLSTGLIGGCGAQNSYLEGEPTAGSESPGSSQKKFFVNNHELTDEGLSLLGLGKEDPKLKKLLAESEKIAKLYIDGVPINIRTSLQHSPALDLVAHFHARARAELDNHVPSVGLTAWLFWQTQSAAVFFQSMGWEGSSFGTIQSLDQVLREQGAKDPLSDGPFDFGVAHQQFGGRVGQAVVLAKRYAEVYGLADSYQPGGSLELTGKVFRPLGKLSLFLGTPDSKILQQDVILAADGTFRVSFTLPSSSGRAFLQIAEWHGLATDTTIQSGYWTTAMMISIFIGDRGPIKTDAFISQSVPDSEDPAARMAKIVEIYNTERAKQGLDPMTLSTEMNEIAKEKLPDIEKTMGNDNEMFAKLATHGVSAKSVSWQCGELDKAVEHAGTSLLIPSYRSIILDSRFKSTGLAVQPDSHGFSAYLQYFIEPLPEFDAVKRKTEIFSTLNQARVAKGRKPFKRHGPTEKALNEFAREVCDGKLKKGQFDPLLQKISKRTAGISGIRALESLTHYFDLPGEDDAVFGELYTSKSTHLAIALCRGNFQGPDLKEYVLLLTFQPQSSGSR